MVLVKSTLYGWITSHQKNCQPGGEADESADKIRIDSTDAGLSGSEDDLVISTTINRIHWSPVQLIPIDPIGSGINP